MSHPRLVLSGWLLSLSFVLPLLADGPADNQADKVRPVPPRGVPVSETDRAELSTAAGRLGAEIATLRVELEKKPALSALLPDVVIYHKAVDWALRYDEFFKTNEVTVARRLIDQGLERATQLRQGLAPWTTATGLVVRGFTSRIDGSVQPYGLVVPSSFQPGTTHAHRLDFWFHGRGETLSELDFIQGRQRSVGEFAPAHTFVLHPYGRYCNGNKFAGETDAFEALEHVRSQYSIDPDRISVRGFSLGGAACWHFAVHHAGQWAAAAPGAGFAETPDFLKVFQKEKLQPTWYEQRLWRWHDCTDWAVNLFQCPTVAYSGEIDSQKQAADVMATAMRKDGLELVHLIGPKTAHSYHPDAKREINRRMDEIIRLGREATPEKLRFTTYTLRYNRMKWLAVDEMERHWTQARVDAEVFKGENSVRLTTKNVAALTLDFDPGHCPLDHGAPVRVVIDRSKISAPPIRSDRSWTAHFRKTGRDRWEMVETPASTNRSDLRKRHGLQGPIDDAFMDSFLVVRPTGSPLNAKVGAWVAAELARATNEWRRHFRGDVRMKDDTAVTEADLAAHHIVLWGDPSSNRLLARLADRLPVEWTASDLKVGPRKFDVAGHVPILIYPNPLNPAKYVVLNSGFTFREYDYLNNARQVPKLPDYAIVDLATPPSSRAPGTIANAGFFGERWELLPNGGE